VLFSPWPCAVKVKLLPQVPIKYSRVFSKFKFPAVFRKDMFDLLTWLFSFNYDRQPMDGTNDG
jgi:hypothetical protein